MPTNKKFRNGTKRNVEDESKNNLANKKKHGFGKGKQNRNQKQQGADGKNIFAFCNKSNNQINKRGLDCSNTSWSRKSGGQVKGFYISVEIGDHRCLGARNAGDRVQFGIFD